MLLLDCDVICYKAGFACEKVFYKLLQDGKPVIEGPKEEVGNGYYQLKQAEGKETKLKILKCRKIEPLKYALSNVKNIINQAVRDCNEEEYVGYLSGPLNFRKDIDPSYKAHRDPLHKPYWFEEIKSYLVRYHNTHYAMDGLEADDMLGILATEDKSNIICTIDKDLDQVPGRHYNFNSRQLYEVDEETANYNFWLSVLTGDAADNIKGPYGIGPKKASKILQEASPEEWDKTCKQVYLDHGLIEEQYEMNKKLLYILRSII